MEIVSELTLISLAALGLLLVCGLGAARLFQPVQLRRHELTLAPLWGLALLSLLGFYGTNAGLTLRQVLPLALGLAVVLLALAVFRRRDGLRMPGLLPPGELLPLIGLLLLTWLVCVLPVLGYGILLPIGQNWDVEFYLPLAEYLKHYSYLTLGQAPTNPLRDLVMSERIATRAMGASYTQALADLLTGRDSWASWVPFLALLRALTLPAMYALLRAGLGVRPAGALAGCALGGLSGVLLWTTYNSFGMGLAGTALLPLAVACALLALEGGGLATLVGAGLLLGGLSCIYWPILQPYGAILFGGGLAVLVERWSAIRGQGAGVRGQESGAGRHETRHQETPVADPSNNLQSADPRPLIPDPSNNLQSADPRPLIPDLSNNLQSTMVVALRGLAILALGGLIGLLAHLRAPSAFLSVFEYRTPSMGVTEYISPAVIFGSAGYSHLGLAADPLATVGAWAGLLAAVVLLALGIWWGSPRRWVALGITLGVLAYLAGVQFVVRFPYGLLRAASYVAPVLLGLVGSGLVWGTSDRRPETGDQESRRPGDTRHATRDTRYEAGGRLLVVSRRSSVVIGRWSVGAFAIILVSAALATYRTYAPYAQRPGTYTAEAANARSVAASLDRPGPVVISAAPELRGPYLGAWAYALRDRPLAGFSTTGYQQLAVPTARLAPAYALLRRGEDPRSYGMEPGSAVWQGEQATLYTAPRDQVAFYSGRAFDADAASLLNSNTTYSRAAITGGSYSTAQPDLPLRLYLDTAQISTSPEATSAASERELVLLLASPGPQTIVIELGSQRRQVALQAGLTRYRSGRFTTPTQLVLQSEAPLILRSASLRSSVSGPEGGQAELLDDTLVLALSAEPGGNDTRLDLANPGGEVLRLAVEVYENIAGFGTAPAHYAWALFPAPPSGSYQLGFNPQPAAISLNTTALPTQVGNTRDGAYFAALWVYQGEQVRQVLPFLLFDKRSDEFTIQQMPQVVAFVRLEAPAQAANASTAAGITLRGYELSADSARPGETARVALYWQADRSPPAQPYLVFVQVLNANDHKAAQWDGAAGGDWYPTPAWQPGQRIWQDVPLQIATDAPPGEYRVIAGLYDPVSGTRLRFADGSDAVVLGKLTVRP